MISDAKKSSVCSPSSEVTTGVGSFRVSCSCLLRASDRWCAMESFSLSISSRSFSRLDVLFSCIFLLKMIHNYVTKNDAPEDDEHSKLLPSWPFRMLSVGSSGCGKSTVMGNMLMNKELKLPFDRVFVISTTLHQPIYQVMMEHFAGIDETIRSDLERELKKKKVSEEKIDETLEALKPTAEFFDSADEFDVEDLDPNQKNLVLLDDIVMEKKQREFIDLYIRGRHRNISPVYLSQSFFDTPKAIRQNCSCFLLFNLNKKERRMIATSCSDLEPDEFNSMFEGLPRYNFVMIDNQPVVPELKYRRNFDEILFPG